MKTLFTLLIVAITFFSVFAQTPNAFKYQTVVRDANGDAMVSANVNFKISILETTASGNAVYIEAFAAPTNQFGLVNLEIGKGTLVSGDFATIDWSNDLHFVKIEVDIFDGNGFQNMGTSQLLSVPYALNAKSADNVFSGDYIDLTNQPTIPTQTSDLTNNSGFITSPNDADPDPINEMQTLTQVLEQGNNAGSYNIDMNTNNITNANVFGLQNTASSYIDMWYGGIRDWNGGRGISGQVLTTRGTSPNMHVLWETLNDNDSTNEIQNLNLAGNTLTITNNTSATPIDLSGYSSLWQEHSNGNDIYYNNGYVGVGLNDPNGKLIVKGDISIDADTAIFEVKNKNGQTVFAVYEEGVRVYVDDSGTKANSSKGGFAIGGFSAAKAPYGEYFRVTPDSVRVYIESGANSSKGGFAIGGFTAAKSTPEAVFHVGASGNSDIIDSVARISWYPLKEAFLAGRVKVAHPDSVGLNSFATGNLSKAIGDYSQAFGDHARAKGNNSTAIGNNANAIGANSYAFGDSANVNGIGSYAIGTKTEASGDYSFAIGSPGIDNGGNYVSGTKATGEYSYAFGMGTLASSRGAFAFGSQDTASGNFSLAMGYRTKTTHPYSTAMGYKTTASGQGSTAMGQETTTTGIASTAIGQHSTASGESSIAMGHYTNATNFASIAMNWGTTASGSVSTAMGFYTTASGYYSTTMGYKTAARGYYSTAMGNNTIAKSYLELAIGRYNDTIASANQLSWVPSDPLFIIGNGSSNAMRHNAMTVLKNGNVGINTNIADKLLTVVGDARVTGNIFYGAIGSATIYTKPDFVFKSEYKLHKIDYIEDFINKNGHLPWLTAAKDEKDGVNMTRMGFETLEAVENQQLQIINLRKELSIKDKIDKQQQEIINKLIKRIEKLENK